MTDTHSTDNGPIKQTEQQRNPGLAKPEDFVILPWNTTESVSGQRENDAEAEKRASKDRGSNYQQAPKRP